ncbi:hypothetical protein [Caballeronia sp. BR00000012568055]|uniref:hypothetical protein n=1 Tax=Caballeronia sp. BR00000012568055 TaxID=2918761 RepID=UPI0023FA1C40|nr:hypothetical protein [Caballeronia sp. BR00000012568055]
MKKVVGLTAVASALFFSFAQAAFADGSECTVEYRVTISGSGEVSRVPVYSGDYCDQEIHATF